MKSEVEIRNGNGKIDIHQVNNIGRNFLQ